MMALPGHYLKKRDLLHNPKTPPEVLAGTAREFLARKAYSDALDFFEKAGDEQGVQEIKQIALRDGDTFLLARLERFNRDLVREDDWRQAGEVAQQQQRPSMSRFAQKIVEALEKKAAQTADPGEQPLEEG